MLRCQKTNHQKTNHQKTNHQKLTQANHSIKLPQFQYVREWDDQFLNLFPHREDYLWADRPLAGTRPQWQTESSHPLSDRQIQQGNYLFGVRFGALTHYLMLDIDPTSIYHPSRDPLAIDNLMAALEPLGLVTYVAVRSSIRAGIHLYLPFQEAQKSWAIARAAALLLTHQGFTLSPGQLELFPNPKPYSHTPTLYNGHRLPLQPGSYLLNAEWDCIYSTQAAFSQRWKFAQTRNDVSQSGVEAILNQAQHRAYRNLRTGGQKYLKDLNADIEPGWTGPGQTNFLLGKIANRERVFHHMLWGGDPLETADLAQTIAQVARSLPGFQEFCQHQTDLNQKATEWARSAIQRYYPYPYGTISPPSQNQANNQLELTAELSWNQKQAEAARKRITEAIADLLNQNALPGQATARRHAIRTYGVGNKTLDKNRDLWHPDNLAPDNLNLKTLNPSNIVLTRSSPSASGKYHPINEDSHLSQQSERLTETEYHPVTPNKLVGVVASNVPQEQFEGNPSDHVGGSGGFSTGQSLQGVEWIKLILTQIELKKKRNPETEQTEGYTKSYKAPEVFLPKQNQPIVNSTEESIQTSEFSLSNTEHLRSVEATVENVSNPYLYPS